MQNLSPLTLLVIELLPFKVLVFFAKKSCFGHFLENDEMQIYKRGMPKERFQRPIEWYHNHWNRLYR
jgi:hypothetical protein